MSPALLLSALIASIYAALFHLWRGQTFRELPLYLIASALGFTLGQLAGSLFGLDIFTIGPIHVIEASLGSWLMLFIARWLKV
jgi:thiamine transporter ThiT